MSETKSTRSFGPFATTIDRQRLACPHRFLHLLRALSYEAPGHTGRHLLMALSRLSRAQRAASIDLRVILAHNGPLDTEWALAVATVKNARPALAEYERVKDSALAAILSESAASR